MTDTIVEPTYDWAAPYAGLGDDALKALGNAGLLRRARKALADDAVTVTSADAHGAVLDVAGATVQVDGRGPAAVSCACPTAGVCQHVLTACLWAAGVAPAGGPDSGCPGAGGSGAGGPGVGIPGGGGSGAGGAVVVGADDGSGGGRSVAVGPEAAGSLSGGTAVPALTAGPASTVAEARPPSPAVLRRRREALAEVRDVVARLMSGGLSHLGPDDAESLTLLAGRVRLAGFDRVGTVRFDGLLRVAGGQVAGLAGRDDAVTESDLLDTFAEVWGMCEVLQRTLDGAVTGTDAQRAPGGSRAGAGDRAGAGGGASREWVSATGKDADDEITVDRWVPLGVRWWTSQSGSRGLAYLGWDAGAGPDAASDPASDLASDLASDPASDPASDLASDPASDQASDAVSPAASDAGIGPSSRNRSDVDAGARTGPDVGTRPGVGTGPDVGAALGAHQDARSTTPAGHAGGRVRQVVTGRPAGTDLRFRRSWTSPLLWDRSLSALCEGPFSLPSVRITPDGALGAGGRPVLRRLDGDGFDLDELRAIAERTGAGVRPRDVVGFGRRPAGVRLVMVRDVGDVGIDDVRQEMTLTIVASDGESRLLRLPVSDESAVETLLSVRSRLVAVTIERREGRDEPVGLFVRDKAAIRLVSPTITPAWSLERSYWDFWRRRIRKLRAQTAGARTVRTPAAPPSPVRRVTVLLSDVLVAVAATGRPTLTARQRSDVEQARNLARDLGLVTVERTAVGLLGTTLSPEVVLQAAFVVGRAKAVVDVTG